MAFTQQGRLPDAAWIVALARGFAASCDPLDDPRVSTEYRLELAEVLVARALGDALERTRGGSA